jgi:hypothetical protein
MVARFGSAREVTLDELRVELIFPADAAGGGLLQVLRDDVIGQVTLRPRSTMPAVR